MARRMRQKERKIAGGNHVLNLEILELNIKKLLNDPSVLTGCQEGLLLSFSASADHVSRGDNERGSFGFPYPYHHHSILVRSGGASWTEEWPCRPKFSKNFKQYM